MHVMTEVKHGFQESKDYHRLKFQWLLYTSELLIAESNQVQRTLMENAAPPFLPIAEASVIIRSLISRPKCTPLDV